MKPRILVLGIGNILWGDEGFGVRAVEAFHRRFVVPETCHHSRWRHAGALSRAISSRTATIFWSSTPSTTGLTPGTLKIVRDDDVPKFTGSKKMSLHQTGFQEVLSAADLLGRYPSRLALVGCQPLDLENWGGPLTEPVRASIEPALERRRVRARRMGRNAQRASGERTLCSSARQ